MAALVILIPPLLVLGFTALAVATPWGTATIYNTAPAPHGFSNDELGCESN
jgi:K+-transporting ATPase A subunit